MGVKAFFISDRSESITGNTLNNDLELATILNLTNLGATGVSDSTVLLNGEFPGILNGSVSTSKQFRREAVENGSADGNQNNTVVLVGDNLNDLYVGPIPNADRRALVDLTSDRYGVYEPGKPAYIPLANPIYGAWEGPGIYNPAEFGRQQWFQLEPAEKNLQRKQALDRWTTTSNGIFSDFPPTPTGASGQKTFTFGREDSLGVVTNFGAVGTGICPSAEVAAEVDTLKFTGAGLTARNLLLTQKGTDLFVNFDGIQDTQVILKNTKLEDIDNFTQASGAATTFGNILFDGQTTVQDSFDVFNADSTQVSIWNRNTVTFLNDLNNTVTGFDGSDDVINGQGGNDVISGQGGNDLLRGGNGNDLLVGGAGSDTLVGGTGADVFVLAAGSGTGTIRDFKLSEGDRLGLSGATFAELTVFQGIGINASDTFIRLTSSSEVLAVVTGVQSASLTATNFVAV